MLENQNIEWKQSWHDDYIKWICGFANARGGTIYIGKDDLGQVTGLANSDTLMDLIPNKIRNLLGIICEVNLHEEDSKSYLEIITQPYSVPVSLRGRYYYRTGSTKMELIGNALNEFLLAKSGNTWDNVLEPAITELNGGILVTLYKNIFTTDQLRKLGLNDRQINVVKFLKTHKSISNSGYQDLNNVRKTTATEELSYLVELGILNPAMIKGRGAYYTLK